MGHHYIRWAIAIVRVRNLSQNLYQRISRVREKIRGRRRVFAEEGGGVFLRASLFFPRHRVFFFWRAPFFCPPSSFFSWALVFFCSPGVRVFLRRGAVFFIQGSDFFSASLKIFLSGGRVFFPERLTKIPLGSYTFFSEG